MSGVRMLERGAPAVEHTGTSNATNRCTLQGGESWQLSLCRFVRPIRGALFVAVQTRPVLMQCLHSAGGRRDKAHVFEH